MVILNQSEAETFQHLVNGERLWSWPNGKLQLGQTFPNLATINHWVREGLLDQNHQPTDAGRSALDSWLKGAAANTGISSPPVSVAPQPSSAPSSLTQSP